MDNGEITLWDLNIKNNRDLSGKCKNTWKIIIIHKKAEFQSQKQRGPKCLNPNGK